VIISNDFSHHSLEKHHPGVIAEVEKEAKVREEEEKKANEPNSIWADIKSKGGDSREEQCSSFAFSFSFN